MFELKEQQDFRSKPGESSVQVLVAVEGCGIIESANSEPVTLAKGDAVVVPAGVKQFRVRPQWAVEFLKAALPGEAVAEPAVRM
jgi:mannose-6-phosphate isomerase-like protein (cupin superfamily)